MKSDNGPKLSPLFGYGLLLMALTGVVFAIRDQTSNELIGEILIFIGFALAYTGFSVCALIMARYWVDIYKYLKRNRSKSD